MPKCIENCDCGRHRDNRAGRTRKLGQYSLKDTKTCRCCKIEKLRSEFYARGNMKTSAGRQVLSSHCKECHRARMRAYASDNPEAKRAANLMKNYGVTPEQYGEMLTRQGGGCAICGSSEPQAGHYWLPVDHDHKTGEVRGILCHSCNGMLGLANDDIDRLQKAIEYLKGGGFRFQSRTA